MTKIFAFASLIFLSNVTAQDKTPSQAEAQKYLNEQVSPIVLDITEDNETYSLLANAKEGDIVIHNFRIFRVLGFKMLTVFNAGYIFLDKSKLTEKEFEALQKQIMKEYASGMSFKELALKYTMDNNKNSAEYTFNEGQTVPGFESAVREHAVGEVFTVDTPSRKWFHIVKKNEENRRVRAVTVEYGIYE